MQTEHQQGSFRLLTIVVTEDKRKLIENLMEKHHIMTCLAVLAKGTTKESWLKHLGIRNANNMTFYFLLPETRALETLEMFTDELELHKPGRGIAYMKNVLFHINGRKPLNSEELKNFCQAQCNTEDNMYKKLSVIVDLGSGDDVIEAAREAGSRGGTIIHGHGSATEEHAKLFGFQIVPEKELVIILIPNEVVEPVVRNINDKLELSEFGNGILYVEDIVQTVGLVEAKEI